MASHGYQTEISRLSRTLMAEKEIVTKIAQRSIATSISTLTGWSGPGSETMGLRDVQRIKQTQLDGDGRRAFLKQINNPTQGVMKQVKG